MGLQFVNLSLRGVGKYNQVAMASAANKSYFVMQGEGCHHFPCLPLSLHIAARCCYSFAPSTLAVKIDPKTGSKGPIFDQILIKRLLRLCNGCKKIHSHRADRSFGSLHLALDRAGLCVLHPALDSLGHAIVPAVLREAQSCERQRKSQSIFSSLPLSVHPLQPPTLHFSDHFKLHGDVQEYRFHAHTHSVCGKFWDAAAAALRRRMGTFTRALLF